MSMLQGATQVAISGGTQIAVGGTGNSVTISHGQVGSSIALQTLSAAAAHKALPDSSARHSAPRCHQNTRTTYLDGLENWMRGLPSRYGDRRLIWLNGGAGAGKSAIMQSIVERCAQHAVILGAFFFSRADPSRNYADVLIPTMAYQLARAFPSAKAVLELVIENDPLILKASLRTQAERLLVHPLLHLVETGVIDPTSSLRRVFVIDGLDECDNQDEQARIIQVIAAILCDYDVPVSLLIASRPETAISRAFNVEKRVHSVFTSITLNDDADARADIRQFIEDSFLDICDTHPYQKHIPPNWPDRRSIDRLVEKSSGHFIYAATVMKFISSLDEHPQRALQVLEGLASSRTGNPFAELDALYLHIITSAKHKSEVLEILRHCTLTDLDSTVKAICFMYPDFSPQDIELFLSDVKALVSLSPNWDAELCVSLKHASLTDFFKDANRSNELYMSAGDYKASLLPSYFMLFDEGSSLTFPHWSYSPHPMDELADAIVHSRDINLLQSLIHLYSPQHMWNFCWLGPHGRNASPSNPIHPRNVAIEAVSSYLESICRSVANHDIALYTHSLKTFITVLMEDINKLIEAEPQYQIIPTLIFSSDRCCLTDVAPKLIRCFPSQPIQFRYACFFDFMGYPDTYDNSGDVELYPLFRAYEAIRSMPEAQMSWGSDLANILKLVLQRLLGYRPTPMFLAPNPHVQWLNKVKPWKHVSQGSPKLPSAVYLYLCGDWWRPIHRSYGSTTRRHRSFDWIVYLDQIKYSTQRTYGRWQDCDVFLKAIIHYLHKCDLTSALARLARRSLPKGALWCPRRMRKARREMDDYVRRWEESPDGLLEKARSLAINDMD